MIIKPSSGWILDRCGPLFLLAHIIQPDLVLSFLDNGSLQFSNRSLKVSDEGGLTFIAIALCITGNVKQTLVLGYMSR